MPGAIDQPTIDAYRAAWEAANGFRALDYPPTPAGRSQGHTAVLVADQPGGWEYATPYRDVPALLDLCCHPAIAERLEILMGEPAGVHLNLTGWVTTERDWHQDTYLNPPEVGDYYAAVWIALGRISLLSGPFQAIPGSHRWHRLTRERVGQYVDLADPSWPKHTEDILTPLVEQIVGAGWVDCPGCKSGDVLSINCGSCFGEGGQPVHVASHVPDQAGDVLIWHSRLYHRGSRADVPGAYRPALIAHYSGIRHRPDMPTAVQHPAGGWYFPIDGQQPVR
jgi:ectoine hydroxylase-related dioxygenase (phytanoyl-CoA dioxygenase family)